MLSDDEWAQLACEIMHRTGLAPYGQEDQAVRWVAVRHAANHIHLVAMLARQDGTRPRLWNDYYRIGEACRAAEHRFGLRATAPRDRTAAHRPTRAESEKARRRGRGVRVVTGDFNGNGRTDIALVRQTPGWGSIPVAFSNGDGTWAITNGPAVPFIGGDEWASGPGVRVVTGDFH
jgi:hypothetical protein